jgi:hypothetical protein
MQQEKTFVNGFIVKRNDNAPDFVLANLRFKLDDFVEFAKANHSDGWLNISFKRGQSGKCYAELDTWKPTAKKEAKETKVAQGSDDLPW